jgi:hypothetical protein
MDHLNDTEWIRQKLQLVGSAPWMRLALGPQFSAISAFFGVNGRLIGLDLSQVLCLGSSVLVGIYSMDS